MTLAKYALEVLWRPPDGAVATLSGFSAYRQIPEKIARNLAKNGACAGGAGAWTLHGNASFVVDGTSITGSAIRTIATAGGQYTLGDRFNVEPGKAYSFAVRMRGDGTNQVAAFIWRDAGTFYISEVDLASAATTWTEVTSNNNIAPGNARTLEVWVGGAVAAATVYSSAVRVMQQTTAPAAWVAGHQVSINKGLAIYEAGTNLATNGDVETALSGTVNGHVDPLADLLAWTLDNGTAFTVAANLVSRGAADGAMNFGHPDWTDLSAGTRFRFKWVTGGSVYFFIRYVDTNNWVAFFADGANLYLQKDIAGSVTTLVLPAAVLLNGNFYWLQPTISGTTYGATLDNDAAGAPGANVVTISAQTISDAAVQKGQMSVRLQSAAMQLGGNFANVFRVVIPAPPGWSVGVGAGVPSFCVSKATKFNGTQALSVRANDNTVPASGFWNQANHASTNLVSYTISARLKVLGVTGTGARILYGSGLTSTGLHTGTADWVSDTATVVGTGAVQALYYQHIGAGTSWGDLFWDAQQAYDTGNSGDGQEFSTATRTASDVRIPLPASWSATDFAAAGVARFDHAYNAVSAHERILLEIRADDNNLYRMRVDTTGQVEFLKSRAGVVFLDNDGGVAAFAAGDTISWGLRFSTTAGMKLWVSKNGGAVATYSQAAGEGLAAASGTFLAYLGKYGGSAGFEPDATIGITRMLAAGTTDAAIAAIVADPYQDPTASDVAVWTFDGAAVSQDLWVNEIDRHISTAWKRGRNYASQLTGRAIAGSLDAVLDNPSARYSSKNTSSPLYGLMVPGRKVRIRFIAPIAAVRWQGFLDKLEPDPGSRQGGPTAGLHASGPLKWIADKETVTAVYTSILTGAAAGKVLDDAAWPAADRTVDAGQLTMTRWKTDGQNALVALREIEETEFGFLSESLDGKIVYEDVHHRLLAPHTSSVATFSDTAAAALPYDDIKQVDSWGEIFNRFAADVVLFAVQGLAVLWTLPEVPSIQPGATRDFWAVYPTPASSTRADHVDAWTTPVTVTDLTANGAADGSGSNLTASIAIAATKYANKMKVSLTNGAAVAAYVTFLQARGTAAFRTDPVRVVTEDATSQTAYGKRTYPLPGKFYPSTDVALSYTQFGTSRYKDLQTGARLGYQADMSDAHMQQALSRDVSDRITVVANGTGASGAQLGISADFYIEAETHRLDLGGYFVGYDLSDAALDGGYWSLGYSALGTGTKLSV